MWLGLPYELLLDNRQLSPSMEGLPTIHAGTRQTWDFREGEILTVRLSL